MKKRVLIPIILALALVIILVPATFAAPNFDTIIEENEVVNNDVVVLDGDLAIGTGAVVNGDVVVFNGDADIDGRINGSLTLFNGDLEAGDNASVSGECVLLNGDINGDSTPGNCTVVSNLEWGPLSELGKFAPGWFIMPEIPAVPEIPALPTMPAMPEMPEIPAVPAMPVVPPMPAHSRDTGPGFLARLVGVVSSSLLFGFLGFLVAAVAPIPLGRIVSTTRNKAAVSGAAGVLTAVAVPSLIVLLIPLSILLTIVCIGLLGFPIILLLALGLFVGGFLGWIAVGTALGERLFNRGDKGTGIRRTAALGTATLTFGLGMLGLLPIDFVTGLLVFIFSAIGLGAVALTQFGMKPYPRRVAAGTPGNGEDPDKLDTVLQTLPPDDKALGQSAD